jgi:putative SOS response-associated peptidase YedK
MCGFVAYQGFTIKEQEPWITGLAKSPIGLTELVHNWPRYQAYPAFGADTNKRNPILIEEGNQFKLVNAVWWFDASTYQSKDANGITQLETVLGKRTSFNARNLESTFWKPALKTRRAVAIASQIGESKLVGKTKHQYLMQSKTPFLLGALYQKLLNGDYCCAIITRNPHTKMMPYHDKAFPFFIPNEFSALNKWLSPSESNLPFINGLLEAPKLCPTLHVSRVKTYKNQVPIGNISATLISDLN